MDLKNIDSETIGEVIPYLSYQNYGTCDFTIGGIYMWADYFKYRYTISNGMLLLMGQAEADMGIMAFAMPVGDGDMQKALLDIEDYCRENNLLMEFSAVPESAAQVLQTYYDCNVTELIDWQDYVYRPDDLKYLKGRKYNARRNHINYFSRTYPHFVYKPIEHTDIPRLLKFCDDYLQQHINKGDMYVFEHEKARLLLGEFERFGFIGGYLEVDGDIVAFSIGEILGSTLFVHVEKALREWRGAYEMINMQFSRHAAGDGIEFINREEDVGDPGLRAAKQSYRPIKMLKKYNIAVLGRKVMP